jgi:uncharacterized membrane protein HdeD (DUF308 family)
VLPTNVLPTNSPIGLFAGRWWAVLLRGVIALTFGTLAFSWPGGTLEILVLLFGFYVLLDSSLSLVAAISGRNPGHCWSLVLEGVLGIWAGVITLRAPAITAMVLLVLVALTLVPQPAQVLWFRSG